MVGRFRSLSSDSFVGGGSILPFLLSIRLLSGTGPILSFVIRCGLPVGSWFLPFFSLIR